MGYVLPAPSATASWYYIVCLGIHEPMKQSNYLIWLGVSVAAGTLLGILASREHPVKGSLLGAAAGVAAGSVAAGIYHYATSGEKVPYYSESSSLYGEITTV